VRLGAGLGSSRWQGLKMWALVITWRPPAGRPHPLRSRRRALIDRASHRGTSHGTPRGRAPPTISAGKAVAVALPPRLTVDQITNPSASS
jgi:hypothetical protein